MTLSYADSPAESLGIAIGEGEELDAGHAALSREGSPDCGARTSQAVNRRDLLHLTVPLDSSNCATV
jgi:hypothetical protein